MTLTTWAPTVLPVPAPRLLGLDALRGLAVLVMVGDHASRYVPGGYWFSITGGRLAVPLFFVVAGALVTRVTWRHGWVAVLGLALPVAVPWIDSPNVLLLLAVGAVVVATLGQSVWRWPLLVVALTAYANQWPGPAPVSGFYVPLALLALMVLGSLLGRVELATLGDRLPHWLRAPGRYPLSLYVGHLLVLQLALGSPA